MHWCKFTQKPSNLPKNEKFVNFQFYKVEPMGINEQELYPKCFPFLQPPPNFLKNLQLQKSMDYLLTRIYPL